MENPAAGQEIARADTAADSKLRAPAMLNLPVSPYLPGRTDRPDPSWSAALRASVAPGMPVAEIASSAAFSGGQTAFEAGYYWEAHELWEAVWMALPPASAERHLMRGLIQLANAGLKLRMGWTGAAARIMSRADAALNEAFLNRPDALLGIGRAGAAELRNRVLATDG